MKKSDMKPERFVKSFYDFYLSEDKKLNYETVFNKKNIILESLDVKDIENVDQSLLAMWLNARNYQHSCWPLESKSAVVLFGNPVESLPLTDSLSKAFDAANSINLDEEVVPFVSTDQVCFSPGLFSSNEKRGLVIQQGARAKTVINEKTTHFVIPDFHFPSDHKNSFVNVEKGLGTFYFVHSSDENFYKVYEELHDQIYEKIKNNYEKFLSFLIERYSINSHFSDLSFENIIRFCSQYREIGIKFITELFLLKIIGYDYCNSIKTSEERFNWFMQIVTAINECILSSGDNALFKENDFNFSSISFENGLDLNEQKKVFFIIRQEDIVSIFLQDKVKTSKRTDNYSINYSSTHCSSTLGLLEKEFQLDYKGIFSIFYCFLESEKLDLYFTKSFLDKFKVITFPDNIPYRKFLFNNSVNEVYCPDTTPYYGAIKLTYPELKFIKRSNLVKAENKKKIPLDIDSYKMLWENLYTNDLDSQKSGLSALNRIKFPVKNASERPAEDDLRKLELKAIEQIKDFSGMLAGLIYATHSTYTADLKKTLSYILYGDSKFNIKRSDFRSYALRHPIFYYPTSNIRGENIPFYSYIRIGNKLKPNFMFVTREIVLTENPNSLPYKYPYYFLKYGKAMPYLEDNFEKISLSPTCSYAHRDTGLDIDHLKLLFKYDPFYTYYKDTSISFVDVKDLILCRDIFSKKRDNKEYDDSYTEQYVSEILSYLNLILYSCVVRFGIGLADFIKRRFTFSNKISSDKRFQEYAFIHLEASEKLTSTIQMMDTYITSSLIDSYDFSSWFSEVEKIPYYEEIFNAPHDCSRELIMRVFSEASPEFVYDPNRPPSQDEIDKVNAYVDDLIPRFTIF